MTELLLLDKSAERIAPDLARRAPNTVVTTWSPEGGFRRGGDAVDPGSINPAVGWISSDVFATKCIAGYGEVLASYPSLQWIQSAHAGLDHPIYPALAKQGVRITKSGAQSIPITEFVLGHVLAHYQGVLARREAQERKEWKPKRFRELWHSQWLIIGYGHIGRGVAKRARAFDCDVTVIRRRQDADEYATRVASLAQLNEFLPAADVVLLACPATEQTRNLADAAFFAQMKKGSVLVNVARGSLVNEDALLAALDQGLLEHAILDVFAQEPLPGDSPLWSHPGVTVAAHTSNAGHGTPVRGDELFLGNLERFLAGRDLYDEVGPSEIA